MVVAMDAHGVWRKGFETRLDDGRGHAVTVDLPVEEGGKDAGTSSLELAVLSLAGCLSTIFALVATKRKLTYDELSVTLRAVRPTGAPTIERIEGRLDIQTSAAKEDVETVLRLTVRTCPVGVLFERAHVPIDLNVAVRPSPTSSNPHHGPGHAGPEPV
jgi:putative redox protein